MKSQSALAVQGVVFNWIGRGASIILAFLMTPFLVHALGDETYGVWSILMTLVSYYGLLDLGLRDAGIKFIAEYDANGNRAAVQRMVSNNLLMNLLFAGLVLIVVAVGACLTPWFVECEPAKLWQLQLAILLTGGSAALTLGGQSFSAILCAKKRFDLVNILGVTSQLLTGLLILAGVACQGGLPALALGVFLSNLVVQIWQYRWARQILPESSLTLELLDRTEICAILKFSLLDCFIQGCKSLTNYSGDLIVVCFLGPAAVTQFSLANGISRHFRRLAKSITSVAMPVASQLNAEKRAKELGKMAVGMTASLAAVGTLITVGMWIFGGWFLELWLGRAYVASVYPIMMLLVLSRAITMTTCVLQATLMGLGRLRALSVLGMIEGLGVLALGTWLVSWYGVQGMAWTIFLLQSTLSGIALPIYYCWRTELSARTFLLRTLSAVACCALGLVPLAFALRWALGDATWAGLAVVASALGSVGGLIVYQVGFDQAIRGRVDRALGIGIVREKCRPWLRGLLRSH